ncbi:Putative ribonuclease H protein At1g65750 [Linum perenne]
MDQLKLKKGLYRENKEVSWMAAPAPGFTLNMDGSVRLSEQRAVAGGCLRDANGKVADAFASNLGYCSITRAEISGIVIGLERAWEAGVRKVEVQTNSTCAIKLLSKGVLASHQHSSLIRRFKLITQRDWSLGEVRLQGS